MKFKIILKDDHFTISTSENSKFEILLIKHQQNKKSYKDMVEELTKCISQLTTVEVQYLIDNIEMIETNTVYNIGIYLPTIKNIRIDNKVRNNIRFIFALRDTIAYLA